MRDIQIIKVGAPITAEITYRGERHRTSVIDEFEIPIAVVARADAGLAATISSRGIYGEAEKIEFFDIEGRLFRPHWNLWEGGVWTAARCAEEAPDFRLEDAWGVVGEFTTPMLGSPFRPSFIETKNAKLMAMRKQAPQARDDTKRRLEAIAERGLRMIDGVLFQATRTPAYRLGGLGPAAPPTMPDLDIATGVSLIDPRIPARDITRTINALGFHRAADRLEIHEPSLLPDTVEADALASICITIHRGLSNRKLPNFARHFVADSSALVRAAENAIRDGASFAPCYEMIERLAERRTDHPASSAERHTSMAAENAYKFLEARRMAPPQAPRPIEDVEADRIAGGFHP